MPRDIRDSVHLRHPSHRPLERGNRVPAVDGARVCSVSVCETRLSRYNPSDVCSHHAGWQDQRQRHHA